MTKSDADLDTEIAKALNIEDRDISAYFDELGMIGQAKTLFRGKTAWVTLLSLFFGTIINVIFFYAAWKFFTVDDAMVKANWAAIAWFSAIMVAFMKVWFWMRMESNKVIREVKRVELQVAKLKAEMGT